MALIPINETHALQIQAGTLGRKAGHDFEDTIAKQINSSSFPLQVSNIQSPHLLTGNPAKLLLEYIACNQKISTIVSANAISTGALATSEEGKKWLSINGVSLSRCKSDLVVTITDNNNRKITVGISTKQCNTKSPTNAQLYFTTAIGFATLLQNNGINVSSVAIDALRQFCGDVGFRPLDNPSLKSRKIDPRRFFWEEINPAGKAEWTNLFTTKQKDISYLLFQKAYMNDPFVPDYLLHKTKSSAGWNETEVAIYSISELVSLSGIYGGFSTENYSVKKGSYKDPAGVTHEAPRFGVIQMQRGGQAQHPNQLQFNLKAGYFYKI